MKDKIRKIKQFFDEGHYTKAADEYEKLAQETGHIMPIRFSIATNLFVGKRHFELGEYKDAISRLNLVTDWVFKCYDIKSIADEYGDQLIKQYAEAQLFKGKALYQIDKSSDRCLTPLREAAKHGIAQGNYWCGRWYMVNAPKPKDGKDAFVKAASPGIPYLEKYLLALDNEEIEERRDIIKGVCGFIIEWYSGTYPVPPDDEKARRFSWLLEELG